MSLPETYRQLLVKHLWKASGEGFRVLFTFLARRESDQLAALLEEAIQKVPGKLTNLRLGDLAYIKFKLGEKTYQDLLELAEKHHEDIPAAGPRFGPLSAFPDLLEGTYQHNKEWAWQILQVATQEELARLEGPILASLLQTQDQRRREALLRKLGGRLAAR